MCHHRGYERVDEWARLLNSESDAEDEPREEERTLDPDESDIAEPPTADD